MPPWIVRTSHRLVQDSTMGDCFLTYNLVHTSNLIKAIRNKDGINSQWSTPQKIMTFSAAAYSVTRCPTCEHSCIKFYVPFPLHLHTHDYIYLGLRPLSTCGFSGTHNQGSDCWPTICVNIVLIHFLYVNAVSCKGPCYSPPPKKIPLGFVYFVLLWFNRFFIVKSYNPRSLMLKCYFLC